mmetsp:Transcript_62962/g.117769  ORF Transcript_62962/g.117769 Transcript_62962/m.117769 type:complete len:162 (+) Transcript_62962:53-538(+)
MPRNADLHGLLNNLSQASLEFQREFFGDVQESSMTYCCGGRMAKTSTKAFQDLEEAERALASAANGENLDGRPLADAGARSEEARAYLDPLTDRGPADTLETQGPLDVEEVESVQSATTRTDFPSPPGEGSMLSLLPALLLQGALALGRQSKVPPTSASFI